MDLVLVDTTAKKSWLSTYKPLLVIVGLILTTVVLLAFNTEVFSWKKSMSQFMAGFFLVFSGFKFLDLKGFAQGYLTYDLLAKRFPAYGYIYPFIELGLGLAYAGQVSLVVTSWVALVVMTFSGIGVMLKVLRKEKFKCVCLGTVIDLPLTTVTIVEDFGMALMALFMLIL